MLVSHRSWQKCTSPMKEQILRQPNLSTLSIHLSLPITLENSPKYTQVLSFKGSKGDFLDIVWSSLIWTYRGSLPPKTRGSPPNPAQTPETRRLVGLPMEVLFSAPSGAHFLTTSPMPRMTSLWGEFLGRKKWQCMRHFRNKERKDKHISS